MFEVVEVATGKVFTVYGLSGTHFLMYDPELDWWFYKNMDECKPIKFGAELEMKISADAFARCQK